MQVTKRNGTKEKYQVEKIKKCIEWATKGISVNPLELEANLSLQLKDGILTSDIHASCLDESLKLATPESPQWRYVAGRLLYMELYKTVSNLRLANKPFFSYLSDKVEKNKYDSIILNKYSESEIKKIGSYIQAERDLDYDYAGMATLIKRYLIEDELPQEMYLVLAMFLAMNEKDSKTKLKLVKRIYDAISLRKISLATPILMNLRKPNSNLSSCFILSIDDDINSIFDGIKDTALISKNGGGVGCNVSKIRAAGSSVNGKANVSGGVVPIIKILNDTAVAINQGGVRAGAFTVGLDIWHLDIEAFLTMQNEEGDIRKKAYDVFPQVIIPDCFMRAKQANEDWLLVDPYEVRQVFGFELAESWGDTFLTQYMEICGNTHLLKNYKWVKANDLWKLILRTQTETGLPYIFYKDTANKYNPNQDSGYIPQANLCCESFSNVTPDKYTHCCNLVSINLANMVEETDEEDIARLAVQILENAIELTEPPIPEAKAHNEYYRTIGIGYMGLADWLAYNKKNYYTGTDLAKSLFERYALYAIDESVEIAKVKGSFGAYSQSEWVKGNLLGRKIEWFLVNTSSPRKWLELAAKVQDYGIRHSQLFAIAPNTSTSLLQGCTASILPPYNLFFYDSNGKGKYPITPTYIDEAKWYYNENINMDQKALVEFIANAIVPFIDSGISMELNFNLNNSEVTPKYISETLQLAWEKECKTIYYVRSVTPKNKEYCIMCAN